ncbi:MAG TPA: sialate O-acetylesterase, partial [Phycisphaerae bacterium]|nr:sialate O-acetylesterase [Phycisphaerae bacterium]
MMAVLLASAVVFLGHASQVQAADKRVKVFIARYPHNLAAMFRDLRKDLDAPDMPIVIGELGVGGLEMGKRAENPDDHEAVAMV